MDNDTRLGTLASAILDGKPIDWESAGSSAGESDRKIVRQLQVVAEIAALHRSLPDVEGSPPEAPTTRSHERAAAVAWGHLRLLEEVGRGAFGEVYRAWDTHLDREVALKLLRAGTSSGDPSASLGDPTRVVHEGRILARVRHPHVITVHGAERREGRVGIWMEYIRGRTLHDVVAEQGPLGPREAAAIGSDLCQALAAVHGAGLLHRDVTARNVMREEGGRVVLMDFGAGHENTAGGAGGDMTGTPLYMAPETFTGARADQRTDIYAVGVLLYHLVTGRYPVTGRSLADIRDAHQHGAQVRLRDVRANLPAAFVRAIDKATAPNPTQRCQTVGELESLLSAALVGTPTPAPTLWGMPRGVAALVAAGVLVSGGIAVTTLRPWRAATESRSDGGPASTGAGVIARKIASSPELSVFSNPSDDGRYVAATVNASGDVAIADLTTGGYRALGVVIPDKEYVSMSVLSADGSHIAAACWNAAENRGTLHVVRSDGSGKRALIDDASAADVAVYQWSRDGSLILAAVVDRAGRKSIALVAEADGAVRRVGTLQDDDLPSMMTISPDARYVAYDYPEGPEARDRDLFIVDTHTGSRSALMSSPGDDTYPMWAPNGRDLVFLSDRSRELSIWALPIENGRATGEPRLLKEDVGRAWPRGFTRAGALHYQGAAGFAEVYIGDLTAPAGTRPVAVSPRQALSNFYPMWSPDGRLLAYTSERRQGGSRELWVYDTITGREEPVPTQQTFGPPFGWSADGRRLLTVDRAGDQVYVVDRTDGSARRIAKGITGWPRWLPGGVVTVQGKAVVLQDPDTARRLRSYDYTDPAIITFAPGRDGRSVLAQLKGGRLQMRDVQAGTTREWQDANVSRLGFHLLAPDGSTLAYLTFDQHRKNPALKVSSSDGTPPRDLLRAGENERIAIGAWTADGRELLVTRWTPADPDAPGGGVPTLWRVPLDGSAPTPTSLAMAGLRDMSLHPDGRRVAFNAGSKIWESWVLENLLVR